MNTDTEVYGKGLDLLMKLHGGESGEQLVRSRRDICPDFATMSIEWALGGIASRSSRRFCR